MEGSLLQQGKELDEYTLVERLGQGGFGEVWKARRRDAEGRDADPFVAIKVATHPEYARSLRTEAEIQAHLTHPNVIHTLAYHAQADPPYIVMEFVDGESLRALLQRQGTLDGGRAASILTPVLSCLSEAHAKGILHRDIKPENILLSKTGEVKLADFGLGKAAQTTLQSILLSQGGKTGDGFLVGTYEYMAPEQRRGGTVDARTDLYAVGVLLHEMLVGVTNPIRLPVPGVSPELSDVIDRAVRIRPEERYDSASQMLTELHSALVPHPTPPREAPTEDAIETGGTARSRRDNRSRSGVRSLGCVAGLMAAMMVGGFIVYSEAPAPRPPSPVPVQPPVNVSGISCEGILLQDAKRPNLVEIDLINDTKVRLVGARLSVEVSGPAAPNGWVDGERVRVCTKPTWYRGERLYTTGRVLDPTQPLTVALVIDQEGKSRQRTFTLRLSSPLQKPR